MWNTRLEYYFFFVFFGVKLFVVYAILAIKQTKIGLALKLSKKKTNRNLKRTKHKNQII